MINDLGATRRRFERVAMKSVTRVFPDGSTDGFDAFVQDIGRGGMGLYSRRPIDVDHHVTLKLQFTDPRGLSRVETVSGRVVWTNPSDNLYLVGIQFAEVVSDSRNAGLCAYIESVERR